MPLGVLGGGPLAKALVRTNEGPVAWLDRQLPEAGRWLSRRVDPASGEGVRLALRGLDGLVVVLDGGEALHGLLLVARAEPTMPIAIVAPVGTAWPEGVAASGWGRLSIGLAWGVGEPLHDRWASAGRLGRSVSVGDPGRVPVVPMDEAVALCRVLLAFPGREWTWGGDVTTFPALARALATTVRRSWLGDRWAGADALRLRGWVGRPGGPRDTPGAEAVAVRAPA